MKAMLLFLALSISSSVFAAQVDVGQCYRTNLLTKVVSVCEAKVNGASAFLINLMSREQLVYLAAPATTIGDDLVFATTKISSKLQLLGQLRGGAIVSAPSFPATTTIYLGYKTGTKTLVYLWGTESLDFLIDLRKP